MKLKNPEGWAEQRELNPPPTGYDYDPRGWPEHLEGEEMGRGYGACVIFAAETWADEMERVMAAQEGTTVADLAKVCFSYMDAMMDRWGLTGFQYGAVVAVLAHVWEHGEELRVWHNLDSQLGDEGEQANEAGTILNPALLSFGTSDS
jgi:hypothetical protein